MSPYTSVLSPSRSMRALFSISSLLPPPSDAVLWPFHPVCPTQGIGSMCCLLLPWVSTSRTMSFGVAYSTGWGSRFTATRSPALNVTALPTFGDHQVGCGGNGDRISCHNAIRDVIFSAAQSAALAPSKESLSIVPSSLSRPADVLLPNWSSGCPAALDVHVISPLQQQTIVEASHTPGHALQVGVHCKLTAHLSVCCSTGTDFIPIVAETLGSLGEDTIQTVAAIGHAIADRSGSPNSSSTSKHLFGRLAIALWCGKPAFGCTVISMVLRSDFFRFCCMLCCFVWFWFALYCLVLFVHVVWTFLYLFLALFFLSLNCVIFCFITLSRKKKTLNPASIYKATTRFYSCF